MGHAAEFAASVENDPEPTSVLPLHRSTPNPLPVLVCARLKANVDATLGEPMRRREFSMLLAGAVFGWPLAARAQQPARVRRVGILLPYAKGDTEHEAYVRAFKQELEKLGWAERRNVQFDEHWTTDDMSLVRAHATTLMVSQPDVVVSLGGRVVPILMQLSTSIPVVLPGAGDPVRFGYAETLARPGKNVTGFAFAELSVIGKSMEILKQLAPSILRVALIYNPDNPVSALLQTGLRGCGRCARYRTC